MQEYIDKLIKQTVEIINKNKAHGDFFNLLMLSGVGSSEVFTHTPILKELLDPNGTHGQKDLFLKSFISYFKLDFEIDNFFSIKREFRCAQGQIDLLLENKNKAIIIENKIYAGDQSKQLNRYYDYCIEKKKAPSIIYLTLQGNKPSQSSLGKIINKDDKYFLITNNEINSIDLQCLSYKEDITKWLENHILYLVKETPNIESAIRQYLNLLKILTGELITVNKELKKMLVDITPVELEAIRKLSTQFNSSAYRGELLFKLFEYVESKFLETGNFEKSSEFKSIHYTANNCKKWFKQISNSNPAAERDVIGCVLKSKKRPDINFIFVAATDYFHYGIALSEESSTKLEDILKFNPTWGEPKYWKKIPNGWVSKAIGDLRGFSGDAFKLLSIKDNKDLNDFINDCLSELDLLIHL